MRRAGNENIACCRLLEAGDDAKRRGLSAAGWAEQADGLAGGDGQIDVADRGKRAEQLGDALQLDRRHSAVTA